MPRNLLTGDPVHAILNLPANEVQEISEVIFEGDLMHHPENGYREYCGKIYKEGSEYIGVTEWGRKGKCGSHSKVVYQGSSIDDARNAVNLMIGKKLDKGYRSTQSNTDALCYV